MSKANPYLNPGYYNCAKPSVRELEVENVRLRRERDAAREEVERLKQDVKRYIEIANSELARAEKAEAAVKAHRTFMGEDL